MRQTTSPFQNKKENSLPSDRAETTTSGPSLFLSEARDKVSVRGPDLRSRKTPKTQRATMETAEPRCAGRLAYKKSIDPVVNFRDYSTWLGSFSSSIYLNISKNLTVIDDRVAE